jgi:O-antigen chain-terminating methyltransferase
VSERPEPRLTPVDALLQSVRPRLDRAADPARGPLGRVRRALRRVSTVADRGWYVEQRDFEVLLRDAIAHLAVEGQAERLARESAERDTTAVRLRVDAHDAALAGVTAAADALADRVRHLENRLRAAPIERARAQAGSGGATAAASAIPAIEDFDYLAFEDRFRGPEDEIRVRQAAHADRLAETGGPVADLGAGRGEMLELLRDRGVEAVGVDLSVEMVALAREKGLQAEHADIFGWLAARPAGSLGGILCSHVVEHLWPADHMRLARLCIAALREGGLLIVETPNPKSLIAGSINFSCDPTHLRPVFPETLAFMLEAAGFVDVGIEYLAPVPVEHRAGPVTAVPEGLEDTVAQLNRSIARLDALVFGERDYAVFARAGALGPGPGG